MEFTASVGYAQDSSSSSYEQPTEYTDYETERIEVHRFDQKVWKEVVGTSDYSEEQKTVKRKEQTEDSTYSQAPKGNKRAERSESDDVEDSEDSYSIGGSINSLFLNIIVYAAAIAIIGYILFVIIKNTSVKPNGKIPKTDLPAHSASVENIKELEIDRLLREAMALGNYRLAIRIYFLGMLKKLDEDGFIVWKKDKTNRDYLTELFSKAHYFEEVKNLTVAYEQVWYGEHNLPLETYEHIIASFKAIDQKLKASKPA